MTLKNSEFIYEVAFSEYFYRKDEDDKLNHVELERTPRTIFFQITSLVFIRNILLF